VGRSVAVVAWLSALAACLALAPAALATDDETPAGGAGFADGLSGRAIYERVAANRFGSFAQESVLTSADRAGREQKSRFSMKWKDFSEEDGREILSKTLVKYSHPFDLRYSGYLIQVNRGRPNDQFVYYPSRRRVVRVNLRSEAVYGTDFSFEDIVPREPQDFDYRRLPDEEVEGIPVRVVELFPRAFVDSEYSKIRVYVERERPVVLRARYWDTAGVAVKEFAASPGDVRRYGDTWVVMAGTMRNLLLESWTRLEVADLEPNPHFTRDTFDLRRLEAH
jgi:hypothetical protein